MKTARPVAGFKGLIASVNGDGPRGLTLAAILALLLLLQLGGAATVTALRYDRSALRVGAKWCGALASACHPVHLTSRHTLPNGCMSH